MVLNIHVHQLYSEGYISMVLWGGGAGGRGGGSGLAQPTLAPGYMEHHRTVVVVKWGGAGD